MSNLDQQRSFAAYYQTLFDTWGQQHWWPGRTRFEVIVGAYLTQNTSWTNVERALRQLRSAGVLSVRGVREIPLRKLELLIRSAGYFRQKARRLKTFVRFLDRRHGGSLTRMFARPTQELRAGLLTLNGIGPETADSILLYAGQHLTFVVDTYTRRVLDRHGILAADAPYEEIRNFCAQALADFAGMEPATGCNELRSGAPGASHRPSPMSLAKRSPVVQLYNEMHGLLVGVGKNYCLKTKPKCKQCPLQRFLPE